MAHQIKQVHTEILKASGLGEDLGPPKGGPGTHPTPEMLGSFFTSYFDHLRTHGHESAVQKINWIIERAIWQLEEDEARSGVVKALFINREGTGLLRNILVALAEGEGVEYQHLGNEELEADLRDSAEIAREAAHVFLIKLGYPEGLTRRKVVWQIARIDGQSEDTRIIYDGNSAGLALAIGMLSAYLKQSIPSDTGFTGALNILTRDRGDIVGVSNVSEKLHTALRSGLARLYFPLQNQSDLSLSAAKAAEGRVELRAIRSLDSAGRELFYQEKDPRAWAIALEVLSNFFAFFYPGRRSESLLLGKYRWHAHSSALLYSAMFFAEGFMFHRVYKVLPGETELALVCVATAIIFLGMLLCYALPQPLMERERRYAWLLSIIVLAALTSSAGILLAQMVPLKPLDTGPIFDWPPYVSIR